MKMHPWFVHIHIRCTCCVRAVHLDSCTCATEALHENAPLMGCAHTPVWLLLCSVQVAGQVAITHPDTCQQIERDIQHPRLQALGSGGLVLQGGGVLRAQGWGQACQKGKGEGGGGGRGEKGREGGGGTHAPFACLCSGGGAARNIPSTCSCAMACMMRHYGQPEEMPATPCTVVMRCGGGVQVLQRRACDAVHVA